MRAERQFSEMIFKRVFMGLRPTQGDENGLKKAWLAITPNFVISTGAQRSGEMTKLW